MMDIGLVTGVRGGRGGGDQEAWGEGGQPASSACPCPPNMGHLSIKYRGERAVVQAIQRPVDQRCHGQKSNNVLSADI